MLVALLSVPEVLNGSYLKTNNKRGIVRMQSLPKNRYLIVNYIKLIILNFHLSTVIVHLYPIQQCKVQIHPSNERRVI